MPQGSSWLEGLEQDFIREDHPPGGLYGLVQAGFFSQYIRINPSNCQPCPRTRLPHKIWIDP